MLVNLPNLEKAKLNNLVGLIIRIYYIQYKYFMTITQLRFSIFFFISFSFTIAYAQKPYIKGDIVANFAIAKMINQKGNKSQNFREIQKEITIIDFFGTWCSPCIRALPNLTKLNEQFTNRIAVVLISTEEEMNLLSFIKARTSFVLPIIVDKDSKISKLFMPPSYPYTVIIGKDGKIIDFTEALSLTPEKINEWLDSQSKDAVRNNDQVAAAPIPMKEIVNTDAKNIPTPPMINSSSIIKNSIVKISQDYIYAAKTGADLSKLNDQLNSIKYEELTKELSDDALKKAFWINIYNGFIQSSLKNNADLYKSRGSFFGKKQIRIASMLLSLDEIEHGILRKSKIKWSLGYLNKLFPSKIEKELRVEKLDYRIHFALNCGAKSCPPIAFYNPSFLNSQLDIALLAYLKGESEYFPQDNKVMLPAILGWFRADFGGKKNMVKMLKDIKLIPADSSPKIQFKKYDWSLYLDNYKN